MGRQWITVYDVRHETIYEYDSPAVTSHNEAHLLPRRLDRQRVGKVELRIDPVPDQVQWHSDYFGNDVVYFTLHQPHDRLVIHTESVVELRPQQPLEPDASPPWESVAAAVRSPQDEATLEAYEYVFDSPFIKTQPALAEFAAVSFTPGRPIVAAVYELMHRIFEDFEYDPNATTLDTPSSEVLEQRKGVCQDFAHLMIGSLRSLGLPARYVSGYLRTSTRPPEPDPSAQEAEAAAEAKSANDAQAADAAKATPPGAAAPDAEAAETGADASAEESAEEESADEAALVGAEASHAWVAVWAPGIGWFEVDPTNDLVPADRHITLAWGRDYDDVSPVKGVTLGGGFHTVEVSVSVRERKPEAEAAPV